MTVPGRLGSARCQFHFQLVLILLSPVRVLRSPNDLKRQLCIVSNADSHSGHLHFSLAELGQSISPATNTLRVPEQVLIC